jgi:hypothetical protein
VSSDLSNEALAPFLRSGYATEDGKEDWFMCRRWVRGKRLSRQPIVKTPVEREFNNAAYFAGNRPSFLAA